MTQAAIRGTAPSTRQTTPPGKRGILAAAIALALPLAMVPAAPALAAQVSQALASAQDGQTYQFDIPAKPLPQAIADVSAVTGLQVLYTEQSTFEHTAPALQGNFSVRNALQQLLAGTGLVMRITGDNSITVELAKQDGVMMLPAVKIAGTLYGSRVANSLADSSASVGVVNADAIQEGQIRDFRQAFRRLGNVMDGDWTDAGFVIRGMNSEGLVPGGAPLASLYIDGVQQTTQGARRGARGLWDVEQMEVYRGPQSTLSGRAAMAGAIYIKTKDPSFEREVALSLTAGSNDLKGRSFMANAPAMDNQLAFRLAGEFERRDNDIGYPTFTEFDRYDEFVEDEYYQLRGKVLYLPDSMPDTQALLSYSFSHDDPYVRDIGGPGLGFDFKDERGDFDVPVFIQYRPTDVHNVGLEITHDLSERLVFTSMTAFSKSTADRFSPNYGTTGETDVNSGFYKNRLASQELRLNYTGERLSWVGGLYAAYEDEKNHYDRTTFGSTNQVQYNTDETHNLALFGELTYEFTPGWKATVGGRIDYTEQEITKHLVRTRPLTGPTTTLTDYEAEFDETNFVPKVGITRELTATQTLGLTYSQGFRTGGASYDVLQAETYSYDPEEAATYELFYKGRLLQERLTLNANLFYTEFNDQQVQVQLVPGNRDSRRIVNAASSESWGFEIEPTWQVTNRFSTFLSIGFVETEFKDFYNDAHGDLSGLPFPEAPKRTIGLGGNYQFYNGIYVGADAKYTSEYLARLGNLPHDYMDSRWIANMQAGYKNEKWEVNVFVENLFDEEYFVYNDNDIAATLGERREVGVNVRVYF